MNTQKQRMYLRQLATHVQEYVDRLGLGGWEIHVRFATPETDEHLDETCAYASINAEAMIAAVVLDARTKPRYYPYLAAHEVLHIPFSSTSLALDTLTEPAKTLAESALHTALDRTARALANDGERAMGRDEILQENPPWSAKSPRKNGKPSTGIPSANVVSAPLRVSLGARTSRRSATARDRKRQTS